MENLTWCALTIGAVVLFSGCGGTETAVPDRAAADGAALSKSYRVLHAFGNGTDGAQPAGTLLNLSGTMYGVTTYGGTNHSGAVYGITTDGTEQLLYSFGGFRDGKSPSASVIDVNGALCGTTAYGGVYAGSYGYGGGTVYCVSASGVETVLHSFGNGRDGKTPSGPLLEVNGTLYGTTQWGGRYGLGAIFSITMSGIERVLHSFGKGRDGAQPSGSLIDVNGTLYGTTQYGGSFSGCGGNRGCGALFSVTPSGRERVVHIFGGGADGQIPRGGVIDIGGRLYGTTLYGGAYDYGTVFSSSLSGRENVLHSFGGNGDGEFPSESLTDLRGTLYGTTGSSASCGGCGTIYSVTKAGVEKVLLEFPARHHGGRIPLGVTSINGRFYGVTLAGGKYHLGTAFSFEP